MRILSLAPLGGPGLDLLRSFADVVIDPWSAYTPIRLHSPSELRARLDGFDGLIVEADHVPRDVLDGTGLRFVGVCRGDPVNVDVEAATKHGVVVLNTPGRNATAVAELTIALMLACLRHVVRADADVRAGRWVVDEALPQQRFAGRELSNSTVGIVGFGAIGRAVATRVRAFGARVCACDPFVAPEAMVADAVAPVQDLGDLFAIADVITLHAPLHAATQGMVGAAELARARDGAVLVNTARYGLVDESALLDALRSGRLAAAALDHFQNEFLLPEHPLVALPNVILTPHIGGSTVETIANHTLAIAEGIAAVLRGEVPASVVNREILPVPSA